MVRPFLRLVSQTDYTMTMTSDMPGTILFEALIVPHRSLSASGRRWLMLAMAGLCGLIGLRFWFLGAWPILGFCGLEGAAAVFLIYLNARCARGSELVMLSADTLSVVRTAPSGKRSETTLSSAWLNVVLEESHGKVPRLLLGVRAQRVEVGAALGEAEKRDLAAALHGALYQARNPVFHQPDPLTRPSAPST
jgi:uncharacterized membrane protein